jgi:hypothetical protein
VKALACVTASAKFESFRLVCYRLPPDVGDGVAEGVGEAAGGVVGRAVGEATAVAVVVAAAVAVAEAAGVTDDEAAEFATACAAGPLTVNTTFCALLSPAEVITET